VSRVPFHGIFLVIAGAWLGTLGACGRTAPGLEPDDWATGGDETTGVGGANGARGGTSPRGGTAGTARGGTSSGGTSTGGSSTDTGGSAGDRPNVGGTGFGGTGEGGSNRGGTGTSDGGSVAVGGTAGDIGLGGGVAVGGSFADGGTVGVGGSIAVGGSAGVGGAGAMGGTGATGGTSTMPPGGIRCGEEICDPSAAVCCSRRGNPSYCAPPSDGCPGVTLGCSGPSTCAAGEVCCFHFLNSSCAATCDVSVGSPGNPPTIILCDSNDDCDSDQTCVLAPRGLAYCADGI
jgi:hypothetical protein